MISEQGRRCSLQIHSKFSIFSFFTRKNCNLRRNRMWAICPIQIHSKTLFSVFSFHKNINSKRSNSFNFTFSFFHSKKRNSNENILFIVFVIETIENQWNCNKNCDFHCFLFRNARKLQHQFLCLKHPENNPKFQFQMEIEYNMKCNGFFHVANGIIAAQTRFKLEIAADVWFRINLSQVRQKKLCTLFLRQ